MGFLGGGDQERRMRKIGKEQGRWVKAFFLKRKTVPRAGEGKGGDSPSFDFIE